MNTINAQTIINEVMAAHAVAPNEQGEYRNDYACFWPRFAPWGFEDLNESTSEYPTPAENAYSALIYDLMTEATSEINELYMVPNKIKFQTAAKGFHTIKNTKNNLQKFADLVRKNAAAFGGGIVRVMKPRAAVTWPAGLMALFKQSIEDNDFAAALDIGERQLGGIFYDHGFKVAPVTCLEIDGTVSGLLENGTFEVYEPVSGLNVGTNSSYKKDRSRQSAINASLERIKNVSAEKMESALLAGQSKIVNHEILRAQWMAEHGLDDERAIQARIDEQTRIDADQQAQREARQAERAREAVAQVISEAAAAVAIEQAMAPTEDARDLATCEAGESEDSAPTAGRASWAPVPQYVPPSLSQVKPGEPVPPAYRGGMDDIDPPSDGNAEPTPRPVESTDFAGDIPLSLAVSAFGGVSMSPERRGASSKSEYGQSMAADYETLRAQAVKGGTLDLLPEVFARYRARQASAYRAYLSSSSRCVSSFIAGPANFPVARMQKRNDIAHKRLNEYLDGGTMAKRSAIRSLRPDLRAIMASDADAIDRLSAKIASAERSQDAMKAANKAIRTHAKAGQAAQIEALMMLGFTENQAIECLKPDFCGRVGFPGYALTNNNANIRRMKERLEQISKAQAQEVQAVECANGVTLEDDAPANRVRLFFPGKPSEAIRDELKSSGFRWAPSVGAWQAYRNYGTLATARCMAGEPLPAAPEVAEVEQVEQVEQVEATPTVAVSTEAPTPAPVEFLSETPAQAAKIIDSEGCHMAAGRADFAAGKPRILPSYFIGISKNAKDWYRGWDAAKLETPTPPAVESQPEAVAPAVEAAQDMPADNANEWGPAIGERYIGAVEYAVQEANRRGDGFEYRTGENALMERRKLSAVTHASECQPSQSVKSKSEKWAALLFMDAGLFVMVFNMPNKPGHTQRFNTASERMKALQAMAKAADAPTDTPPGGGLPCPTESAPAAPTTPVATSTPGTPVAVSSANDPKPAKRKIADIRRVIKFCDWVRIDLGGATVNEFKAMDVPGRLMPHIEAVKALEIPPRYTKDIESQAWSIECANKAIARWQAKQ